MVELRSLTNEVTDELRSLTNEVVKLRSLTTRKWSNFEVSQTKVRTAKSHKRKYEPRSLTNEVMNSGVSITSELVSKDKSKIELVVYGSVYRIWAPFHGPTWAHMARHTPLCSSLC